MVIEDTSERTADMITELLSALFKSNVITPNQMYQVQKMGRPYTVFFSS